MAGSLSSLPTSKQELCAPQCTVCLSHAPQMIAPPVVWPPLPLRVEGQLLCLCALGARSEAGEEPPNADPPRASPVRTRSVRPSGTPMRTSTRLLGDGKHGQAECIQTFRGPACRTTFTCPSQYAPVSTENSLAPGRHGADHALAEGLDPSAASRVFGFRQATITTWLSRAGEHAHTLHVRFFSHLHLPHLQLDELRTRLRCSQHVRLSVDGDRPSHQDAAGA